MDRISITDIVNESKKDKLSCIYIYIYIYIYKKYNAKKINFSHGLSRIITNIIPLGFLANLSSSMPGPRKGR